MFFKRERGVWHWAGVYSNRYRDDGRPSYIFAEQAHRDFVQLFYSGEYPKVTGQPYPYLYIWHLPLPIGEARAVAYDERGFALAAGVAYQGYPYDDIFQGLSRAPVPLGMSHMVPGKLIQFSETEPDVVTAYIPTEFSVLEQDYAANVATGWAVQGEA